MKTAVICLFALATIGLLVVAGCTTSTGNTGTSMSSATSGTPSSTSSDQNRVAMLVNGTYAFNASIDEITATALPSGGHRVDIFVKLTDTGTTPVQLQWFSTLTNTNGASFGGVGVSHGGDGAETPPIWTGDSATGRDYVTISSDQDYQSLAKGAALTVNFVAEPMVNQAPASFSATWALDPLEFT